MKKDDRISLCMDDAGFKQWTKNLHVPRNQTSYQTLIEEYMAQSEARRKRKEYAFLEQLPAAIRWEMERRYKMNKLVPKANVLAIEVSDKLVRRACILMDYLLVKLKELGADITVETYKVYQDNTKITWKSIELHCYLEELKTKNRNLSSENRSKMAPPYEEIPTGKLSLSFVTEEKDTVFTFRDQDGSRLEDQIIEILTSFRTYVVEKQKAVDEKRELEHQQWLARKKAEEEKEELRKEQLRILEQENRKKQRIAERKQQIEQYISDWERTKRIQAYLDDLYANMGSISEEDRKSIVLYCEIVRDLYKTEDRYRDIIQFVNTCTL